MQDDPVGGMHLGTLLHLTGRPIRHEFRLPSQENLLPPPNAILVAPLSANTLNKWAAGHADALALGLITEAIGLPIPIVALPHYNTAQAAHPAIGRSVATLREAGVNVLLGPDGFTPHPPGESTLRTYPWQAAIDALPTPR
ncbi:flavoprotein [Kitasatospora aureofaciens]|nr:flavoprotein [Kitasatospora aureofaciens]